MKYSNQLGYFLSLTLMVTYFRGIFGSDDDTLPETCGSEDPSYNFTKSTDGLALSPTTKNRTMPQMSNPFPFLSLSENSQMTAETHPIQGMDSNLQCHQTYHLAGFVNGGSFRFRSQGYPSNAPDNTTSVTCFHAPDRWKVSLTCQEFKVDCDQGHIGIYVNDDPQSAREYCGGGFGSFWGTTPWSNKLGVIFKTGGGGGKSSEPARRFKCQITVVPPKRKPIIPPTPGGCKCGQRNMNKLQGRIVNGTAAQPNEFPWRCLMYVRSSFCSCTLISSQWVMTAAHCLPYIMNLEVVIILGGHEQSEETSNMVVGEGRKLIRHPGYVEHTYGTDNDIALIELEEPISFTDTISPICLPWKMAADDFKGCTIVTSGWGDEELPGSAGSNTLNKLNMKIVSNQKCAMAYDPATIDGDICAHTPGKTPWSGDSGSSMDLKRDGRYYAIGIAAWVDPYVNAPTIFTRVTKYLDWIRNTTGVEKFCGE